MSLFKTTITRGKAPLEPSNIKPNGIYAVRTMLTPELCEQWGVSKNRGEQWGLVQLDDKGRVFATYNVLAKDTYIKEPATNFPAQGTRPRTDVATLSLFTSTPQEREFMQYRVVIGEQSERILKVEKELSTMRSNENMRLFNEHTKMECWYYRLFTGIAEWLYVNFR